MVLIWTVLITASLGWNLYSSKNSILSSAYDEARTILSKDISVRHWGASHGGVYVPVTEKQQPIKWLSHIKDRDVEMENGKMLTLINPAAIMRQLSERYAETSGIQSRITSLKPINPLNAPDDWETNQLHKFERGETAESWEINYLKGEPFLRHLQAMMVEPRCMKCHAEQGYQVGDIRGGVGIKLPLSNYYKMIDKTQHDLIVTHSTIWLIGLGVIWLYSKTSLQSRQERISRLKEREEVAGILNMYESAFRNSGEATLITGADDKIINANSAFFQHTGYEPEDVIDESWAMLQVKEMSRDSYRKLRQGVIEKGFWQGESYGKKKNGLIFPAWLSISRIQETSTDTPFFVSTYIDITELKQTQERVAHLAHHDVLTKLHNRYSLTERLRYILKNADKQNVKAAVLFIDLDRFKTINDSLGHQFGDKLLIEVSKQIKSLIGPEDMLARFGGDEFVLVRSKINSTFEVATLAIEIQQKVKNLYTIDNRVVETSASTGICIFPDDGTSVDELLKNADIAMYHAKATGRNNYQFFTESLSRTADERLKLENLIRDAFAKNQFELHFQPIFESATENIVCIETLVRWKHPEQGYIPPDKFIPIAEETGFIHTLGDWILEEACKTFYEIKRKGCLLNRVAINLSVSQLQSNKLISKVNLLIQKYKLAPGELEFEITETAAMNDPDFAVSQLNELNQLGVSIAIDDFGTGYSSMAYLKRLPLKTLKLDRTFVKDIGNDINDEEICTATISLAHNLGLKVVAEGVENQQQLEFLRVHGCEYLQGYFFSKPMPIDALCDQFMEKN